MNLELLDPFRRQIPDRVDATLSLPSRLLVRKHSKAQPPDPVRRGSDASSSGAGRKQSIEESDEQQQQDKAAYTVAFNRRGAYLTVGHASGEVAVHDFLTRTISALYRPEGSSDADDAITSPPYNNRNHGITSATWSRRSRTILAGAVGDAQVRLMDTSHPAGPEECSAAPTEGDVSDVLLQKSANVHLRRLSIFQGELEGSATVVNTWVKHDRQLETRQYAYPMEAEKDATNEADRRCKRFPILSFSFPRPVGGSLQVHPRDVTSGLAVLDNGSLVLFRAPPSAWESIEEEEEDSADTKSPVVTIMVLDQDQNITCAAFDPRGERIFAATKHGNLMGFDIRSEMRALCGGPVDRHPLPKPQFSMPIPGGATVWHLTVSRNGKHLLLNCADGALRLYNSEECWAGPEPTEIKPKVFQDVVSKVPFASCDFSGDAEYIVGGCNANDNKYELFLWNAATGALMDRLTGAQVTLHCVAWHPTRSFVAVATSDGLVDIWGPRMDWTAFAPDFQALPMNVEYIEREDEFDIVEDKKEEEEEMEDSDVNVVKIEPVPVFASDSESESEVFAFKTKINNVLVGRRGGSAPWLMAGRTHVEDL